jgi:arabinofuranosyltransferase
MSESRPRTLFVAALVPLLAFLGWQAIRTYWLCDDAFISFRYVRNLVEGRGLVFNPGERVEGYTNFLWVLELAAIWKVLGIRPEAACWVLSLLYTAGTIALTIVLALRTTFRECRYLVACGALLLLGASHTFAIWATSGLETRQFTFFVLLAAVFLGAREKRRLVLASLALALAESTRPEANLLWLCALGWLWLDRRSPRDLLALAAPYVAIVAVHFLWRWSYYGDLWPNTYYAKHVRGWPEAGIRYFGAATIEFGLYALVPLAVVGARARLRAGDRAHLLALAWIVAHAAYVLWIGGDHFEYRPLDFYWPFLSIAAVEGIASLARPVLATALYAVLLVATSGVQLAKEIATEGLTTRQETHRLVVSITPERFPRLCSIPGLSSLFRAYSALNAYLAKHGDAVPYLEHRVLWLQEIDQWSRYEAMHGTGAIPADAVTFMDSIGVEGYYLPDLVIVDNKGLTDRHVAHQPVTMPNDARYMAHERTADWPYLEARGLNMLVHPSAWNEEEALDQANYALRISHDLWMPFDSLVPGWPERAFKDGPEVRSWRVAQSIGCFADGTLSGWTVEGDAFANNPRVDRMAHRRMHPYRRCDPEQVLDSRGADPSRPAKGVARSPLFRVPSGADLEFRIGGKPPDVGVRLLDERGTVVHTWHPDDPGGLTPQRFRLRDYEGRDLRLEVFDDSGEAGGFVVLGEAVLLVPYVMNGS